MVINIVSTHRFHLLDLARELSAQGHDVKFYSYVTPKRCLKYGLERHNCVCFLWLVWVFFILEKVFKRSQRNRLFVIRVRNRVIDWYVSHTIRKCDVLIALGCVYSNTILKAKNAWNAVTILEWGSKHIIEQLKSFGKLDSYPPKQLSNDLNEYKIVDYISIPATHVKDSFLMHGVPEEKLVVNPYGVNLYEFQPTICTKEYDLIYVGGWRFEKGSDLLIEVCQQYGYRLLHVGSLVNLDFPRDPNMTHHEPVNQKDLINYYKRARVFVLPSRSEGLSLVQAQAMACGLPIVCSSETGGFDLRDQLKDKKWVVKMKSIDVQSLHCAIEEALVLSRTQEGVRSYCGDSIENLSWYAYGKRYSEKLMTIVG